MAKVGSFTHRVEKGAIVTFDTSYGSSKFVKVDLHDVSDNAHLKVGRNFGGSLQLIRISGTETTGEKVSTITLQGYTDQDGTELLIEPTEAVAIDAINYSSSNRVSALFLVDAYVNLSSDSLFLFAKTGQHAIDCDEVFVTWVE
tara:strand:- start:603 stop:1034 length:432 start_codon:yes stop_codon:yes gene_type:complete